jgi:hypothetical protein
VEARHDPGNVDICFYVASCRPEPDRHRGRVRRRRGDVRLENARRLDRALVAALVALYFNVFVGVVQAFQKMPFLNALAPTQSDPPFVVAQLVVLVAFIAIGVFALRRFHRVTAAPMLRAQ